MKNKSVRFPKGVHRYMILGDVVFAEYMGRQKGFECAVCGKGGNALTFNILHGDDREDALNRYYNKDDYETVGIGRDHVEGNVMLLDGDA